MRKAWFSVAFFCIVLAGCSIHVFFGGEEGDGEYIIKLRGDIPQILGTLDTYGLKVLDRVRLIDAILCRLNEDQIQFLESLDMVEYVEKNATVYALGVPEPQSLWEMLGPPTGAEILDLTVGEVIPGGVKRVGAPDVWDQTTGLDGVTLEPIKVAILDTGISTKVPDLAGAVVGGYNAIKNNADWEDDNNHGTYIASVIGARRNGKGIVGVMPDTQFYAVKVLSANGSGYYFNLIKGLEWISQQDDIELVNISLGGYHESKAFRDAVAKCAEMGIGCIAAAGNDGEQSYGNKLLLPARYSLCVSVGAVDVANKRAAFSNYGDALKSNGVMAPGVYVAAYDRKGNLRYVSGTSLSTPHVTGAAVMLRAKRWCIRKFIFQGSDRYEKRDIRYGHGMINYPDIMNALNQASCGMDTAELPGMKWE